MEEIENHKVGFFGKIFGDRKNNELIEELEKIKSEENKVLSEIREGVLSRDIEAMYEAIIYLAPLDDLLEYGIGFGIDLAEDSILVSFSAKIAEMIPTSKISLTPTGRESTKKITDSEYNQIAQDYICSLAIRVARDIFALLPLSNVYVNAYDEILSKKTGRLEEKLVLSVNFDKKTVDNIFFDNVDPSEAIDNFEHNMNFLKTKGFSEVESIIGVEEVE